MDPDPTLVLTITPTRAVTSCILLRWCKYVNVERCEVAIRSHLWVCPQFFEIPISMLLQLAEAEQKEKVEEEEEEGDEEEEEEKEKEDAGKPKSGQGRGKHIRDVRIIFLGWIQGGHKEMSSIS